MTSYLEIVRDLREDRRRRRLPHAPLALVGDVHAPSRWDGMLRSVAFRAVEIRRNRYSVPSVSRHFAFARR